MNTTTFSLPMPTADFLMSLVRSWSLDLLTKCLLGGNITPLNQNLILARVGLLRSKYTILWMNNQVVTSLQSFYML